MPQLDLAWFFFNFLMAWTLVLLVASALSSQKWKNNSTTSTTNQTEKTTQTKKWQW